ncbi:hypothetical protein CPB85DRAFT_1197569, partial [Mucidula mucida]
ITQLRTGHIGLNAYLHRMKIIASDKCAKCGVPESVEHYLLVCRRYTAARSALRQELGRQHLDLRTLLSTPKNFKHLFAYVDAT